MSYICVHLYMQSMDRNQDYVTCKYLIQVPQHSSLVEKLVAEMFRNQDTTGCKKPGYCWNQVYMHMSNQVFHVAYKRYIQNMIKIRIRTETRTHPPGCVRVLDVLLSEVWANSGDQC